MATRRLLLFHLGMRKDWLNLAPTGQPPFDPGVELYVDKEVFDVSEEVQFNMYTIEPLIFMVIVPKDRIGNPSCPGKPEFSFTIMQG